MIKLPIISIKNLQLNKALSLLFTVSLIAGVCAQFFYSSRIGSYIPIFTIIFLGLIAISFSLLYMKFNHKIIGYVCFDKNYILIEKESQETYKHLITSIEDIEFKINGYRGQTVIFFGGNFMPENGFENLLTFKTQTETISIQFFIKNEFELIDLKSIIMLWEQNIGKIKYKLPKNF